MRKLFTILSLCLLASTISAYDVSAETRVGRSMKVIARANARKLADVCKSTRSIQGGEIWKSIASTHIPTSDPRRFSTSFITNRGTSAPSGSCLTVYDSAGNTVHALGQYFPTGSKYSSRYYGGHGCGDKKTAAAVAALAKRNTKSTTVYIKINSRQCIGISTPNRCFNSVAC